MLFLRSWLEDYINLKDYSDSDLSQIITMKSGEVEGFTQKTDYFDSKLLIGKIENLKKHPDADKLSIFDINLGPTKVQIISAADNVREGLIVPAAMVGCRLGFLTVSERKMRGELSQGVCLGKSELMLETKMSEGLWELNELLESANLDTNEVLGKSICTVFPQFFHKQTIIDIKYLADQFSACSSHLGLSLELSIILEKPELLTEVAKQLLNSNSILENIKNIQASKLESTFEDLSNYSNSFNLLNLELQEDYILPHQLQTRMFLLEKNMVGNIADLSNYLLYDIGQPSHFFSQI